MHILIVDDSRSSLAFLAQKIAEMGDHAIETCLDPALALARSAEHQFDLVILDNIMPGMNGVELTGHLRNSPDYRLVPIIMVTSDIDKAMRIEAIAAGANDFLPKPFDTVELQARVRNLLALRQAQIDLADRADWLAREVEIATRHVVEREEELIWRLARAIEFRDGDTGGHVSRVAVVSRMIAEGVGLSPERCRMVYLAAPLHDVGKIGIADAILSKPGKLTPDELAIMRRHVDIGARILERGSSELIRTAELIAQSHHERWDGNGYPDRLSGSNIPIEARIVAIADVFDALCSERPYKAAWPAEDAYREIVRCSATQFDPACVAAFEARWADIVALIEDRAQPEPLAAAS
ncbi:transcriptional regulator [Devosia limi DSM 17137]|uniref:Putative two-component system response regulator n=1 Tax=Devosia limi DSM 17137 TaxID=1121477 RepID=A0A0F5LPX9_9HYPH|nr:HD domain-containing phosphohydrolase [Devosia limi]KKB84164.1 transcriptional regulator [Devosia limi DSM 17137]SHE94417.1 putative two-component system response regulator [Devosia limi DSM 17137]